MVDTAARRVIPAAVKHEMIRKVNMNDETPIEELKEEEKTAIPVEEEIVLTKEEIQDEAADVADAFRDFGRQFAETIRSAWNSEERLELERELREGVQGFAEEVGKVLREAKESPAAQKIKEEAGEVKTRVDAKKVSRKARTGLVEGLTWLSEELGKMAEQFTPPAEDEATEDQDIPVV
jgi:hypothetical protein